MAQVATFDDLAMIPDADMRALLRDVDHYTLAIALKGAPGDVRDGVLRNLAPAAAARMEEEVSAVGPVAFREHDQARTQVLATLRYLHERGDVISVVVDESMPAPAQHVPGDRAAFNAGYAAGWTAAVRHKGAGLYRAQAHLDAALKALLASTHDRQQEQIAAFRDMGALDDRSMARLLTHIRHEALAQALTAMDESFREQVYAHMSAHAVGEVCDDIAHLGPMRERDVEAAQADIGGIILAGLADGSLFRRDGGA